MHSGEPLAPAGYLSETNGGVGASRFGELSEGRRFRRGPFPQVAMRIILVALAGLGAAGCGYIGEPLPPLANVPARVTDLAAIQRGSRIVVSFTLPRLTTEGMPLKAPALELRIGAAPDPFREDEWAASATRVPAGPVEGGTAIFELPAVGWTGKTVALAVRVTGVNAKSSGWSNFVTVGVVPPPETPAGLQAEATANGVRLSWHAAGQDFRIFRRTSDDPFIRLADVAEGPWIDPSASFGKRYTYRVQTVVKLGENREAESDPSGDISITPEDRFPPAVPTGLAAVSTPTSVELTWDGDTEPDLAGYRIYRAESGIPWEKVADAPAIPSYSDHRVERGRTYRYAITAVDQSGNESSRSAPTEIAAE